MGILHDELLRAIGERCTNAALLPEILRHILRNHGATVPEEHLPSLVERIVQGADCVEVPGDEAAHAISITEEDVERAMRDFEATLEVGAEDTIARVVAELAPRILQSLYDALPEALLEWHATQRAFEERLYDRWKDGLDRLDMLITMAHEAGETYVADLRREFAEESTSPTLVLMDVLTALHCRACRTAREIVCLLKSGYADGAHARWRSLHEIAVIAHFLLEHRNNTPQRFLDHAAVECYRAALQYQEHCQKLGYEPFAADELAAMKIAAEAAIDIYGESFREDYGWAAAALQTRRPTFATIEASLKMAHWRPWFRLACQNVHAGSRGLHFALGIPRNSPGMLLAGASDAGLTDPGHQMAISLTMVTAAFLTAHPNLDGLVACHCMLKVCDDIGRELLRVHEVTRNEQSASPDTA